MTMIDHVATVEQALDRLQAALAEATENRAIQRMGFRVIYAVDAMVATVSKEAVCLYDGERDCGCSTCLVWTAYQQYEAATKKLENQR